MFLFQPFSFSIFHHFHLFMMFLSATSICTSLRPTTMHWITRLPSSVICREFFQSSVIHQSLAQLWWELMVYHVLYEMHVVSMERLIRFFNIIRKSNKYHNFISPSITFNTFLQLHIEVQRLSSSELSEPQSGSASRAKHAALPWLKSRSHGLPTATAAASSCVVRLCRRMESWRAWNQGSNSLPCDPWNVLSYDILWSPMHTYASFQHHSPCKAIDSDWAVLLS